MRERHERGCAVVKIMASGGNITPGSSPHLSQFSLSDLRIVVEEASRLGLPVAAHARGPAAIRDAVTAGVHSIEHVTFMTEESVDADPELLSAIAESETFVSIHLGHVTHGKPHEVPPRLARDMPLTAKAHAELHRLGARIIIGPDSGAGWFKPHDVLPYGVADLAELGPSPLEALATVTSRAAEACLVSDRKGQVKAGFDADFLVLDSDPVSDLRRLRDVRAVIRSGARVN